MPAAIHPFSVADGEAFLSASRLLFGPITQRFPSGTVPSIPKLVSVHLGACRLSEITANPHLVLNDQSPWRSFDPDAIKLLIQLNGQSRFGQHAVSVDLRPRSAIIYDPVRPYSLRNMSDVDQLILQVPRSTFGDEALARLAAPVPLSGEGMTRIVCGLMRMAMSEADRLDQSERQRVGESLIQFVGGLIRGKVAGPGLRPSPLAALRDRIVAYVDANLARGDLSPADIARHMRCSRRYLHRAFEGEGTTLERFIRERRLERSKAALASPANRSASISEIAFACGFNSSAHFSRAFRNRYEIAPRELRQRLRSSLH